MRKIANRTPIIFRMVEDEKDWNRLTSERVTGGWYYDASLSSPVPTAVVDRCGDDIYTAFGWNQKPETFPILAHIEVPN